MVDTAPARTIPDPAQRVYLIDAALRAALRAALIHRHEDPTAVAAAQLDLEIRQHPLFESLVDMLRTGRIRVEEPRRMSATAKAALLGDPDVTPPDTGLGRARGYAGRIVTALGVPEEEQDVAARRAVLLARECLQPERRPFAR